MIDIDAQKFKQEFLSAQKEMEKLSGGEAASTPKKEAKEEKKEEAKETEPAASS